MILENLDILKNRVQDEIEDPMSPSGFYGRISDLTENLELLDISEKECEVYEEYITLLVSKKLIVKGRTIMELLDRPTNREEISENVSLVKSKKVELRGKETVKSSFFDDDILKVTKANKIKNEDIEYYKGILETDLLIDQERVYKFYLLEKNEDKIKLTENNQNKINAAIRKNNEEIDAIEEILKPYYKQMEKLEKKLRELNQENDLENDETACFLAQTINESYLECLNK